MSNFFTNFIGTLTGHTRDDYMAIVEKGRDHAELEENQEALDQYNAAINLKPNRPEGYAARASLYDAIGEYEKAIEDYNTLLRIFPKDTSAIESRMLVESHLARKLKKAGKTPSAV
jgi:tetratricopeptide (TPR) repeat protein